MPHAEEPGITPMGAGVLVKVCVAPRASQNKVLGTYNGALKIALTAPPVEGAANKALVEFLAKTLGVPKSAVSITSGETSRHKVVKVDGLSAEEAAARLTREG